MKRLLLLLTAALSLFGFSSCKSTKWQNDPKGVREISSEITRRLMAVKKINSGRTIADSGTKNVEIYKNKAGTHMTNARITYYYNGQDRFGDKVASSSSIRAKQGITVAVDPRQIPYGSRVKIPYFTKVFGDSDFLAQDTGTAIKSRKASKGKTLVIDVFVNNRATMKRLMNSTPAYLPIYWREG